MLTWQRRGFRVRSAAAVASTSLPALRDRSVGVQPPLLVKHWGGGGCFQTLGWKVDKTQTLGVSGLLPLNLNKEGYGADLRDDVARRVVTERGLDVGSGGREGAMLGVEGRCAYTGDATKALT